MTRLYVLAFLYSITIIVAGFTYPGHVLAYGITSWFGGVLFVLSMQAYYASRNRK